MSKKRRISDPAIERIALLPGQAEDLAPGMIIMVVFGNSIFPTVRGLDVLMTRPQPHLNLAIFRITLYDSPSSSSA